MNVKGFIVVALFLISNAAISANRSSDGTYEIKSLTFHSNEETIYPDASGVVAVYPEPEITWLDNANCESRVVIVKQGDDHLVSALLAAYVSGTKVRFYVDDSVHASNTNCYLRAVGYQ